MLISFIRTRKLLIEKGVPEDKLPLHWKHCSPVWMKSLKTLGKAEMRSLHALFVGVWLEITLWNKLPSNRH